MRKNKKGFTLVELVIVIAVIAILAAVLVPTFATVIESARESSRYQRAVNAEKEVISSGILPEDTIGFIYGVDEKGYYIVNESGKLEKMTDENVEYVERVDINTGINSVKLYTKVKVVGSMKINGESINITDANVQTYFNYSGTLELKPEYVSTLQEIVLPTSIMISGSEYTNYSLINGIFANCSNLTKITIPANVTLVWGNLACNSIEGLEVIFEEGVTSVGDGAFSGSGITRIKSVSLPSTLQRIGVMSFANCNFEENLFIPAGVTFIDGGVILSSTVPGVEFEDPTGWSFGWASNPPSLSDPEAVASYLSSNWCQLSK